MVESNFERMHIVGQDHLLLSLSLRNIRYKIYVLLERYDSPLKVFSHGRLNQLIVI